MKTLALINQKGGVWKTTGAVTIAHGLAMTGRRVLLVDLDAQGNVADALGLKKCGALHEFLVGGAGRHAITSSGRTRLEVILGDRSTARTIQMLSADPFGVHVLRDELEKVAGEYDICVLDVAPGASILQMAALVACTHFLIPVALAELAVVGAQDALGMAATLKRRGAYRGEFLGVLPTQWERTTSESQRQLEAMQQNFQRMTWPPIPMDTKAREAPRYGKSVLEYAPQGRAARGAVINGQRVGGYVAVIRRLMGIL